MEDLFKILSFLLNLAGFSCFVSGAVMGLISIKNKFIVEPKQFLLFIAGSSFFFFGDLFGTVKWMAIIQLGLTILFIFLYKKMLKNQKDYEEAFRVRP